MFGKRSALFSMAQMWRSFGKHALNPVFVFLNLMKPGLGMVGVHS
jgi:hypothetical protein